MKLANSEDWVPVVRATLGGLESGGLARWVLTFVVEDAGVDTDREDLP